MAHRSPSHFPIVGLGASAGGLGALERFFAAVAPDSGMAFVVVTHQQPGRQSLLPELLGKAAKIPVTGALHGMSLRVNHAYVAPPSFCLTIRGEQIQLEPLNPGDPRLPIDHFFRSLAEHERDRAIAIVLSGTGSDGTRGIAEIKANAGLVLAQDPSTAQYPGMPQSAIATKMVDYILGPERMQERLQEYVRSRYTLPPEDPQSLLEQAGLLKVLAALRHRTQHDFTAYKKSTIRRRVQRRMNVHGFGDPREYADYLEQTPFEIDALFKELLISVTSFFRDPEVFAALEAHFPALVERKADGDSMRAWIAGCATGEEAYSIAIILRELCASSNKNLKVQLFATDLDPHAIEVARAGCYPEGVAADITPERLKRFFTKEDSVYRVNKDVRESVVFATQNLIRDPPFSKLDLVSCRNLLIYLEHELQRRVLQVFSYSLLPQGILVLGTSESITGFDAHFLTLEKRWKLFQRRPHEGDDPALPDFGPSARFGGQIAPSPATPGPRRSIGQLVERVLLTKFAPPTVVIGQRGEIIYIHGKAGPYLEPHAGEPSNNLLSMAREGLHIELSAAIRQANLQDEPVVRRGVRVKSNGGYSAVRLSVHKLNEPEQLRGTLMVSFELEPPTDGPEEGAAASHDLPASDHIALELELQRTRENLQGTIEELESSNEELKSTNEELQSTNEELQSTNEELETSREEMQSLNEELQTVNVELGQRNRALSETNDDMQNLLNSTDVATLFLDDRLHIRRFTTQAKNVFSLIDTDVGRPISDLVANLRHDRLLDDAREVLRTLSSHEQEIQTKDGAWRLLRIMPYRTHDNLIGGLVLTFFDIDRLRRGALKDAGERTLAQSALDALPTPLLMLDSELVVISANRAFYRRFRATPKQWVGEAFAPVIDDTDGVSQVSARLRGLITNGAGDREEFQLSGAFARLGKGDFILTAHPMRSSDMESHLLVSIEDREGKRP
jgi:two-component system, chemotaxis family, CheB/CheR fusion protein